MLRPMKHECWTLIFSHPEDFVPLDLEIDRWLVVVREAFLDRNVQPLRLASQAAHSDSHWTHCLDWNISAEIEKEAPSQRFVMIADGDLRSQKTFAYQNRLNLPSPLDFLARACLLRTQSAGSRPRGNSGTSHIDYFQRLINDGFIMLRG